MGQGLSCSAAGDETGLFSAVQLGKLEAVEAVLERDSSLIHHATIYDRHSALHIAAANGHVELVSMLLDRSLSPNLLNRHKQTPLMLAAMNGKISCVQKLIQAGANILMFDSLNGRTCLHYTAYYGHSDCLQAILSAARSSHIALSWGFARFVNLRDGKGATPLHLSARRGRPECVNVLLDNGALVCASIGVHGGYGFPGSTPLHLAARGGSLDCTRALLARGADRLQRDAYGRIPYSVALRHKHGACAALLNPSSTEPLVWPSPLKFISELDEEVKALLEKALMEVNRDREKNIFKGTPFSLPPSSSYSDSSSNDDISEISDIDLCCICFDQACTIEIQDCNHQMCARCTLALCCQTKPGLTTLSFSEPVCPFCRSAIARLARIAKLKTEEYDNEGDIISSLRRLRSHRLSEGSSSFRSLSALGPFSKMDGPGSGKMGTGGSWVEKPES